MGPDLKPIDLRLVQTAPGVYEAPIDTPDPGNYVVSLQHSGEGDTAGRLVTGLAVNTSPELRDLHAGNRFLQSVQVAAWACLASSPRPRWLSSGGANAI